MKFAKTALTILYVSSHATAWTAHSLPRSRLLATQFHAVATDVLGEEKTETFRLKFKDGDKTVSPWHDIDLANADGTYNMVRATVHFCLFGMFAIGVNPSFVEGILWLI